MRGRSILALAAVVVVGLGSAVVPASAQDGSEGPTTEPAETGSLPRCDIDGDGRAETILGMPSEDHGEMLDAGQVLIVPGREDGPALASAHVLVQGLNGVPGEVGAGDRFGAAIACGDLDADGVDELIIGAPGESGGDLAGAGSVIVYGRNGTMAIDQDTPGVPGKNAAGDHFGAALASGDVDGDGVDEVVIGVPGKDSQRRRDSGAVVVLGRASARAAHQGLVGIAGANREGDHFGAALAMADLNGDGTDEIVVGVPGKDSQRRPDAGAVIVLGDEAALVHQGTPGVPGRSRRNDGFGAALAATDLNGDGRNEVAIGVPGKDIAGLTDAGAVIILRRGRRFRASELVQGADGVAGILEAGDRFGRVLAAGDHDGDGAAELAVGVPDEGLGPGLEGAGAVVVVDGSPEWPQVVSSSLLIQGASPEDTPGSEEALTVAGVGDVIEPADAFGSGLSFVDTDGDGAAELAATAPGDDPEGVLRSGLTLLIDRDGAAVAIHEGVSGPTTQLEVGDGTAMVVAGGSTPGLRSPLWRAVGDSLLVSASEELALAAALLEPDGVLGRSMTDGIAAAAAAAATEPDSLVIELGTNGGVTPEQGDQLAALVAAIPNVIVVTVRTPDPSQDGTNAVLRRLARTNDNIVVADWHAFSEGQAGWLDADGIHLTATGQVAYAQLIAALL